MANFILLTTPRSGSTWLGSLLDDHPDIDMYGELFLPHDVPEKYQAMRQNDPEKFFRFRQASPLRRPKVAYAYLDHVFGRVKGSVGFKLMAYPLLKHPEIILYCKKHNIKILHLTRNIQERVISYAIAEVKNDFHKLEQSPDKKQKINLSSKRVKHLYRKQKWLARAVDVIVKNGPFQSLSIDYAALSQDHQGTLKAVYDFIGVKPHTPKSDLQKSIASPYEELVENYDEIAAIFKR